MSTLVAGVITWPAVKRNHQYEFCSEEGVCDIFYIGLVFGSWFLLVFVTLFVALVSTKLTLSWLFVAPAERGDGENNSQDA